MELNLLVLVLKSFQKMGDKIEAKRIAKKFGLPVIEGSEGGVKSLMKQSQYIKKLDIRY